MRSFAAAICSGVACFVLGGRVGILFLVEERRRMHGEDARWREGRSDGNIFFATKLMCLNCVCSQFSVGMLVGGRPPSIRGY